MTQTDTVTLDMSRLSLELWSTARRCEEGGLSGRALRKVLCPCSSMSLLLLLCMLQAPFLALALYCSQDVVPGTQQFVHSLGKVVTSDESLFNNLHFRRWSGS